MDTYKFDLAQDTQQILQILLNDELILRYLTYAPTGVDDDITTVTQDRPSITESKTYEQRLNDYYLSPTPYLFNHQIIPNTVSDKTLLVFYANVSSFKNNVARSQYAFEIYSPFDWHKYNCGSLKILSRLIHLFRNTHSFGNLGKINCDRLRPIKDLESTVGYKFNFHQYNTL